MRAYNAAVGSLERSVLPGARKFVELGVRSERPLEELEAIDTAVRASSAAVPELPPAGEESLDGSA